MNILIGLILIAYPCDSLALLDSLLTDLMETSVRIKKEYPDCPMYRLQAVINFYYQEKHALEERCKRKLNVDR
jgi:hypothetical protein